MEFHYFMRSLLTLLYCLPPPNSPTTTPLFYFIFFPVFYLSGKDNPACPSLELGTQKLCGQDKPF